MILLPFFCLILAKLSRYLLDVFVCFGVITFIRMKYAFHKFKNIDFESLETLITSINPEKNAIITAFGKRGVNVENALGSQALLQLKSNYSNKKRCLQCAIGMSLLQRSS